MKIRQKTEMENNIPPKNNIPFLFTKVKVKAFKNRRYYLNKIKM